VSSSQGRWASTKFIVKERLKDKATLLELHPLTGRTHQIRVHLASFQHPIVGDHVYGTNDKEFSFVKRHMLHASSLEFFHPVTKKSMKIEAPWPLDFQETLKLIRLIP
jgi:23S rRNA-/tRNA-specific pseudouridylate synthase